jgi:cell division protein FtsZ
MREGPLADLFRSTDESVEPEDVTVSATKQAADPAPKKKPAKKPAARHKRKPAQAKAKPAAEASPPESVESYRVTEEPAPDAPDQRERLAHLIGKGADVVTEKPTFGREEPDPDWKPAAPRQHTANLRVVGVGGAGVNAVNRMVEAQIPGVEFMAINTDLQSLQQCGADITVHIGSDLTRGLGAGADPTIGYKAAFDEQDKIKSLLKGSDMVFVTAGAGGGTGTGAAPVIAKLAHDVGALTVGIVTKPFAFEGPRRAAQAEEGIAALTNEVDTMIVVPNEKLLSILERKTSIVDAFRVADDVLRQAVQGISDLVTLPGLINLDFADVRTTMLNAGSAVLGIGMGTGENRATTAAQKAVASPLLDTSVEGSRALLLSITGGPDLSLIEASEAARVIQEAAHPEANIIFGAGIDEDLSEQVWVTVIATQFDSEYARSYRRARRSEAGPRRLNEHRSRADLRAADVPEFVPRG